MGFRFNLIFLSFEILAILSIFQRPRGLIIFGEFLINSFIFRISKFPEKKTTIS